MEIEEFLRNKDIDGVFAVNEHYAIYAVKALQESGRNVPEDVSVVGFTNGELSKRFIPSLTTVSQHGAKLGAEAAKLLIEKLESNSEETEVSRTIVVETELIERNSTKTEFNIRLIYFYIYLSPNYIYQNLHFTSYLN